MRRHIRSERGQAASEYLIVSGIVAAIGLLVAAILSQSARAMVFGAVNAVRTIAP